MFDTYDPRADSVAWGSGECQCGCQTAVKEGRQFLAGHDAILKSKLTRLHLAGDELVSDLALQIATDHGWQSTVELAALRKARRLEDLLVKAKERKAHVLKMDDHTLALFIYPGHVRIEAVTSLGKPKRVRLEGDAANQVLQAAGLEERVS